MAVLSKTQKPQVLVAMSGGIDSSVAAYLLQQEGFEVIGITFQLYDYSRVNRREGKGGCCSIEDVDDARIVADQLGIRHYLVDTREDFKSRVIDYFANSYQQGLTPNPCVACNTFVKFDELAEHADRLGIQCYATGHYAQLIPSGDDRWVHRAKDPLKDQSYFLMGIPRQHLDRALFPCGAYTKTEIKQIAHNLGLITTQKKESMEICFVTDNNYKNFLKQEYKVSDQPGEIVTTHGEVVGSHQGLHHYTIGQRKGLGALSKEALYVVKLDSRRNQVIVGSHDELFSCGFWFKKDSVWNLDNWLNKSLHVKVRSRSPFVAASLIAKEGDSYFARFDEPQRAVSPGQFAVFYFGSQLVGGGPISKVESEIKNEQRSEAHARAS